MTLSGHFQLRPDCKLAYRPRELISWRCAAAPGQEKARHQPGRDGRPQLPLGKSFHLKEEIHMQDSWKGRSRLTARRARIALAAVVALTAGSMTVANAATTASAPSAVSVLAAESSGVVIPQPTVKEPTPELTPTTFADPPIVVRPKYRWWLPLADETDEELRAELHQIKLAGGGGAEITVFAVPNAAGTTNHTNTAYLAEYGYGSPKWNHRMQMMQKAAADEGLILDSAAGPRWPPTSGDVGTLNDPAVAQKVIYGKEFNAPGSTRTGALPNTTTQPPSVTSTVCGTAPVGGTTLKLNSTNNIGVGDVITVGAGAAAESVTVTAVGTSTPCSTLALGSTAGASNVKVRAIPLDFAVGDQITVGAGADAETAVVTEIGTAAVSTTLSSATAAGATTAVLASATGVTAGSTLVIDSGANVESAVVASIVTATRTVTFTAPLGVAHAAAATVVNGGTGITLAAPLAKAHTAGDAVAENAGTGLTVSPLAQPHSAGEAFADVAKKKLISVSVAQCAAACTAATTGAIALDRGSVADVTGSVDAQGNLSYTFPAGNGNNWIVLPFYQTADGQSVSGVSATGNRYVLDHLSAAGADAIATYWDNNVLNDPVVKDAIARQNAESGIPSIFEDSLELSAVPTWTGDFSQQFQQLRGYDVKQALPVLAGLGFGLFSSPAPAFTYSDGESARMVRDYKQTWNDLYASRYLTKLQSWAQSNGLTLRAQAYGGPVDSAQANTAVGIPEGEGFEFSLNSTPDQSFKVVAAGANMSGANVVSTECCAMFTSVWATTAKDNLTTEVYIGMAGGNNAQVWHGFPYAAAPANSGAQSVWPGWSYGGNTSFSEARGPRSPQWLHEKDLNDNLARLNLVLRQGTPQYDVAVYYQNLGLAGQAGDDASSVIANTSAMNKAGYSYGYASSSFFKDAATDYQNGRLFPGKSDYKALVVNNLKGLDAKAGPQLVALAKAGLPIVVIGAATAPSVKTPGYNTGAADAAVTANLAELYAQIGTPGSKVLRVATEAEVPAALASLGVNPAAERTSAPTSGAILNARRHTADTDYYYLYNNSAAPVDQTLTLTGNGTPYLLDTWTGKITPIATYTSTGGKVTVNVKLDAKDVKVIALTASDKFGNRPKGGHATSTTATSVEAGGGSRLTVKSTSSGTFTTTLADGSTVDSTITGVPAAAPLSQWSLTVDSWTPGPTGLPLDTKHTDIGPIPITANPTTNALPAWTAITPANGYAVDLSDVAGVGTYTSTLTLPDNWTGGPHAYLNLGTVVDTGSVWVNGHQLPPVDFVNPNGIDLGDYLTTGANTIKVVVASPLINAVRVAPNTGATGRARTNNGLVGPVVVTPYGQATISTPIEIATFSDVPVSHPFVNDIEWAVENGITTGYPDGTFHPAANIERQAMAAFLYRATHPGQTAPACTAKPFDDVPATGKFCPEIQWMKSQGLAKGTTAGDQVLFKPANPVDRQSTAAFLYRLKNHGQADSTCTVKPYPDVALANQFCGAIAWMKANGYTNGYTDGGFHPAALIPRDAAAAFLHRVFGTA